MSDGILVSGSGSQFTNNGLINIGNKSAIGRLGLFLNGGIFTNAASGTIEINNTVLDGVQIFNNAGIISTLINNGFLKIGNLTTIGRDGILHATGTLQNSGNIEIKRTSNLGIETQNSGTSMTNSGSIVIDNPAPAISNTRAITMFSSSNFTNTVTGTINIKDYEIAVFLLNNNTIFTNNGSIEGNNLPFDIINLQTSASFINNGSVKGGNSGTLGRSGLNLRPGSSIMNNAGGTIEIDNITNTAVGAGGVVLRDGGGTVTNAGIIKMGTVTAISAGIVNNNNGGGVFNNTGTLTYGNIVNDGVGTTQTVTNQSGGIIQTTPNGFLKIAGTVIDNSGANTNNNATGSLSIASTGTLLENGTLNNNGTATNSGNLKGSGTIVQASNFTNGSGSFIKPGQSPGQLNVTGNFDLGSTTYNCEINGTTAATQYDVLAVSAMATLTNSNLVVNFGSFTPAAGQSFTIFTAGSIIGTFSSVTIPSVNGLVFTVTYTSTSVIINSAAVLPITLLDFKAIKNGSKVFIDWQTVSEFNNAYFEVERSLDGVNFITIDRINVKGNSTTLQSYNAVDNRPFKGLNYYRLKQVDIDGKFSLSFVRTVNFSAETGHSLSVYPNPAKENIQLELPKNMHNKPAMITIIDLAGNSIKKWTINNVQPNGIQLFVGELSASIYMVQVMAEGEVITVKMIKE